MLSRISAHLRDVLFMSKDIRMSWATIVTPKLCACTLVSTVIVVIVGDVHVKNAKVLNSLEFRQVNPVKFVKFIASR